MFLKIFYLISIIVESAWKFNYNIEQFSVTCKINKQVEFCININFL